MFTDEYWRETPEDEIECGLSAAHAPERVHDHEHSRADDDGMPPRDL